MVYPWQLLAIVLSGKKVKIIRKFTKRYNVLKMSKICYGGGTQIIQILIEFVENTLLYEKIYLNSRQDC